MQSSPIAAFSTWSVPFWPTLLLVLTAAIYLRGWTQIRLTRPTLFPSWRPLSFLSGLAVAWVAIASPLDSLANLLLVVHMTQHLLLMSVAPPLIVLGAPTVPLLRGLPRFWVREGLGPFFTSAPVHALERWLKSRIFAWSAMNLSYLAWHVPAAYDRALAYPNLHEVEHACFFLSSVLFWWPIIEPWPVRYKGSRWMLLPYLMSADLVNTALSAFLSFSGRVIYPVYEQAPRLFGLTALNDQIAAGSLMWVFGSIAFLIPLMYITARLVSRRAERRTAAQIAHATALREQAELRRMYALEAAPAQVGTRPGAAKKKARQPSRPRTARTDGDSRIGLDLFALPVVQSFFASRWGRPSLQAAMLLLAAAVIVDGFFGHPMGSMNLAGIVPWIYARALFVLALLLVGNLFCMSCPFMLPRELAKRLAARLGLARLAWPRALRNKWLAAVLLVGFFWAYEALALWNSPARTAWLLVAYFLTAIVIDSVFRGASFCKWVCPLGQFNFVSSLLSPVELAARSASVCGSCSTRDCIAGSLHVSPSSTFAAAPAAATQRGCELDLFMPLKSGNLDCTLCMDCVKACPHDNIGLFVQAPGRELVQIAQADPQRSSVGRLSRRADVAGIALVIVGAAYAGAAVMVAPVTAVLNRASAALPAWLGVGAGLALAASVPAALLGLVVASVLVAKADAPIRDRLCRWSLALLPLGLGMWAAHLCFHLGVGWNSIVPGAEQALRELLPAGWIGMPSWGSETILLGPGPLLQLQLAFLDAGLLFALYLGWRMVRAEATKGAPEVRPVPGLPVVAGLRAERAAAESKALRMASEQVDAGLAPASRGPVPLAISAALIALAPWAVVALLTYAAGVWLLLQPMQMRRMVGM